MEFEKYKANIIKELQDSLRYFGNDNKLEREKWVVEQLLKSLSVEYRDNELRDAEEPVDVRFRQSDFQIKEVLLPDRQPRGRDIKDALERAKNAKCFEDFLDGYSPREINMQCILNLCLSCANDLLRKYAPRDISDMDLLFYFNASKFFNATDYHEIESDFEVPDNLQYRSVSIVSNRFRIVVHASKSASEILQQHVGCLHSALLI